MVFARRLQIRDQQSIGEQSENLHLLGIGDEMTRKAGDAKAATAAGDTEPERDGLALQFICDNQGHWGRIAVAQGLNVIRFSRWSLPDDSVRLFKRVYAAPANHPDHIAHLQVARS